MNEGFLPDDIPRRLAENWATNPIDPGTVTTIYSRKFLLEHAIEFPNCFGEDRVFQLAAMCHAKKYLVVKDLLYYVCRLRRSSVTHNPDVAKCIESMAILSDGMKKILDKIPALDGNRLLKDACMMPSLDVLLNALALPFYDGKNISPELDNATYDALLPIFGERTLLVKHLFHSLNSKWRQANIFVDLLNQREDSFQKQSRLIEQMKNLLAQYEKV